MSFSRFEYIEFIKNVRSHTKENLENALEQIAQHPDLCNQWAQDSPKFVEIFHYLHQGIGNTQESFLYFQIILKLCEILGADKNAYFGQLHYLADAIIKRNIYDIFDIMNTKRGSKLAMDLLLFSANVNPTHCRELYSVLDFSNHIFGRQSSEKSPARQSYVKLATVFLNNPDICNTFLGSRYYISSIWRNLVFDDQDTIEGFIEALINNIGNVSPSILRRMFSDNTLHSISRFSFDGSKSSKDPKGLILRLLKLSLIGENSIINEDPKRCYCMHLQHIDPAPKNLHLLNFIIDPVKKVGLDPWKKRGHCDVVLLIFQESPDLISHYFSKLRRDISDEVTIHSLTSLFFISKVIELPWPSFLNDMKTFYADGRSLDLLFESILPSFLETNRLSTILKKCNNILIVKSVLTILINAIQKFKQLPDHLKTHACYSKLDTRIPQLDLVFTNKSQVIKMFGLKLLQAIEGAIPFFLHDNHYNLNDLIKKIDCQPSIIKYQLINIASSLLKPINHISILSNIALNESSFILRKASLEQINKIIFKTGLFESFKGEIPLWIGFSITNGIVGRLIDKLNRIMSRSLIYLEDRTSSPLVKTIINKKPEDLYVQKNFLPLISLLYAESNIFDEDFNYITDIPTIISSINHINLAEPCILLINSLSSGNYIHEIISALKLLLLFDYKQVVDIITCSKYIINNSFEGNEIYDDLISLSVYLTHSLNDELTMKFLDNNVSNITAEIISPYLGSSFTGLLLKKLLRMNIDIRQYVRVDNIDIPDNIFENQDFVSWAFEGYNSVDLNLLISAGETLKRLKDEDLILDILRTALITGKLDILVNLRIRQTDNERLLFFATYMISHLQNKLPVTIPLAYIKNFSLEDPVQQFEECNYSWALSYLIDQIVSRDFSHEISKLNGEKARFVLKHILENPNPILERTFKGRITYYISKNPKDVSIKPKAKSIIFSNSAKNLTNSEKLVSLDVDGLKGVCNIYLGCADFRVPMNVILYLASMIPDHEGFYDLLEEQGISPLSFYFVTGDSAKLVIQQLDNNQEILPDKLAKNSVYIAPFHSSHKIMDINSSRFRFLLYFSNYLIRKKVIPINTYLESGAINVIFKSLSSKDEYIRSIGYSTLYDIYDLNRKKEWDKVNIFNALLEALLAATVEENAIVPYIITNFLTTATNILLKPYHKLYSRVVKYLLASPSLRINQVPLFKDIFNHPNINYRNERLFLLKMIVRGLNDELDVNILNRNKAIEHFLHQFSSPMTDMVTRKYILDIVVKYASIKAIENIHSWVLSVISESFSTPHVNHLVLLLLETPASSNHEKEMCRRVFNIILQNPDALDRETLKRVKNLIN